MIICKTFIVAKIPTLGKDMVSKFPSSGKGYPSKFLHLPSPEGKILADALLSCTSLCLLSPTCFSPFDYRPLLILHWVPSQKETDLIQLLSGGNVTMLCMPLPHVQTPLWGVDTYLHHSVQSNFTHNLHFLSHCTGFSYNYPPFDFFHLWKSIWHDRNLTDRYCTKGL